MSDERLASSPPLGGGTGAGDPLRRLAEKWEAESEQARADCIVLNQQRAYESSAVMQGRYDSKKECARELRALLVSSPHPQCRMVHAPDCDGECVEVVSSPHGWQQTKVKQMVERLRQLALEQNLRQQAVYTARDIRDAVEREDLFLSAASFLGQAQQIPGLKAQHAIVTPTCRANRTPMGAFDEAVRRIRAEYEASLPHNEQSDFHLILTVVSPLEARETPGKP